MDWQTPVAVAIAVLAAAYVLWRLARPFFQDKSRRDEPLQIGDSDDSGQRPVPCDQPPPQGPGVETDH
jgi:hypothetical protein